VITAAASTNLEREAKLQAPAGFRLPELGGDGLVATGFVTREPHPTDRRATLVTFTEHAATTVAAMERDQQKFAHLLFAGMPDEQFDCFVAGLGDVLTRLRDQGLSYEIREDDQ